jgi:hypothetical protein
MKKIAYKEPADYFPEEIRKKYKLGEYSEDDLGNAKTERDQANKDLRNFVKNGK